MHAFEVDQKQEPARELVSLQEAKEQPYATAKFLEVQDVHGIFMKRYEQRTAPVVCFETAQ